MEAASEENKEETAEKAASRTIEEQVLIDQDGVKNYSHGVGRRYDFFGTGLKLLIERTVRIRIWESDAMP